MEQRMTLEEFAKQHPLFALLQINQYSVMYLTIGIE